GWSLSQVADLFGISVDRVRRLRESFILEGGGGARPSTKAQRRKMNLEEEAAFLAPFFESASAGTPEVGSIRQAMEKTLGRSVSLSTVYNLLHRHGWGNLAPHMRHRKADGTPRED
ncbi:MAG: winged helix-turn-helix domain-containing protein, partial [Candidatus Accumulibacter sp.]|nr:winged helix-turn-helix domain-containing protein [Accumulibacter sp.]